MKNYIKNMGYFLLPPTVLAYDKQKHALLGFWLSVGYFLFKDFEMTNFASAIYSLFLVIFISYIIEIIQLFKPNRVFDHKDVLASVGGWFLMMLIIFITN